jgi:hypothetical protein
MARKARPSFGASLIGKRDIHQLSTKEASWLAAVILYVYSEAKATSHFAHHPSYAGADGVSFYSFTIQMYFSC